LLLFYAKQLFSLLPEFSFSVVVDPVVELIVNPVVVVETVVVSACVKKV